MNKYIKGILSTRGWHEIEKMFLEVISKSTNLEEIDAKLDNETVARESRVKAETSKALNGLLKKIKLAGQDVKEVPKKILR